MTETTEQTQPAPGGHAGGGDWFRLVLILAVTVGVGVWTGLSTIAVILALVFMIFMHELGHYITAKAAGMKVTEFFIGFGPRLWSFRKGETEYGLKAIPAGAYVRIVGMSNLEEIDPADEARTYRQKSYPRRMSVALAGSTMHFLMALVLVGVVVMGFGVPDNNLHHWTVGALSKVEGGPSPAQQAGIRLGDRILSVNGRTFTSFDAMAAYLRAHPGDGVTLAVERGGHDLTLTTTLANRNPQGDGVGFLGVGPEPDRIRKGPVSGTVESLKLTGQTMWLSVKGLASLFSPKGISGYLDTVTSSTKPKTTGTEASGGQDRFVSLVGVVRIADDAAKNNVGDLLAFLFAINIFIGLFNLVPLLPFDGGHVAIATYERIRSRKGKRYFADVRKMLPITYAVVLVLAFIFVTSTYLDIAKPLTVK